MPIEGILGEVVSRDQGDFVTVRQIVDRIITAQKVIHSLELPKKSGNLITLNMPKDSYRIKWNFIVTNIDPYKSGSIMC